MSTGQLLSRGIAAPWRPESWRAFPAAQQPPWPAPPEAAEVTATLAVQEQVVSFDEIYALRRELARVAQARGFVVQAGDCAETYDCDPTRTRGQVALIQRLCHQLSDAMRIPVVPVGRIAGQYAKPRSSPTETVNGVVLPSYRGHLVNSPEPDPGARVPDPGRMLLGYDHARTTLRLLRDIAERDAPMRGHWGAGSPALWTSHEALVLDYEEPLVRRDPDTGSWLLTSTHLPWVGERTRQLDGAHLHFVGNLANPVGCKIGPAVGVPDVLRICERLDPDRQPGRLLLITRMGAVRSAEFLPRLVAAVRAAGHPVVWMCDPMHANTYQAPSGHKTRRLPAVLAEVDAFFAAVWSAGGWPGGLHIECTNDDVTECVGAGVGEADLPTRYLTCCDPRLNAGQIEELARRTAQLARAG